MATIQITDKLMNDIMDVIIKHDEEAIDAGIGAQYMSALVGYMIARYPSTNTQKKEIMHHLTQFSEHVMLDNIEPEEEPGAEPGENEAFGVWKPGDE